jgi:hypothetical protein
MIGTVTPTRLAFVTDQCVTSQVKRTNAPSDPARVRYTLLWRLLQQHVRERRRPRCAEDGEQSGQWHGHAELAREDGSDPADRDDRRDELARHECLDVESGGEQRGRERYRREEHRGDAARDGLLADVQERAVDAEVEEAPGAPRSALPRGSGMRNAPAIANSSTDASVSRIVAA